MPTTVAGVVAEGLASGLNPANYVPASMQAQCLTVALNNIPGSIATPNSSPTSQYQGFLRNAQAFLIVRGLIYYKNTPGDCGTPTQLNLTGAEITQGAGNLAAGIASFAGLALPGIGVAVSAITTIFANHAKAVATEQDVLCQVAGIMNQVIPYYDAQVRAGNISPSNAYVGMQNFIAQVNGQLKAIMKTCDAACLYSAFLQCHYDFVQTYYPAIAPIQAAAHAPGAPPVTNTTTPGGIVQVGTSVYPQPVTTSGAGQVLVSGGAASLPQPAQAVNVNSWLIIGAAIVILLLLFA